MMQRQKHSGHRNVLGGVFLAREKFDLAGLINR